MYRNAEHWQYMDRASIVLTKWGEVEDGEAGDWRWGCQGWGALTCVGWDLDSLGDMPMKEGGCHIETPGEMCHTSSLLSSWDSTMSSKSWGSKLTFMNPHILYWGLIEYIHTMEYSGTIWNYNAIRWPIKIQLKEFSITKKNIYYLMLND